MGLIIFTIICLIAFILLLRSCIRDAKEMPETFENLHRRGRISKDIYILLQELKKKQQLIKN